VAIGILPSPSSVSGPAFLKKHGLSLDIVYTQGAGETQQAVISGKRGIDAQAWRKFNVPEWGKDVDRHFNNVRTAGNLYQQDRAAMNAGNFTGIKGIPNQDIAMWESMDPISDRSQESVGVSDIAVNAFRRLMVEAAGAVRERKPAIGTAEPRVPHASVGSLDGVVLKATDWRTLGRWQRHAI
jgi:phthalate 4,5-dioxygenase